jgi:predicted O-methyltransferase YrrM
MSIKENITNFLENGISAWTGENIVRYPTSGNPVFLEFLEKYKHLLDYEGITTFFECGTFNGNNAADFANVFEKVVSVEFHRGRHDASCAAHGSNQKIVFLHGDATAKLKEYLIENPNERMVILLDDHTDTTSFIHQELEAISQHSNTNHIIIIDDADQLGNGTYPTYETIVTLASKLPLADDADSDQEYKVIHDKKRHKVLIFRGASKQKET